MQVESSRTQSGRAPSAGTPRDATVVREIARIPGVDAVHGVTCDGELVWAATGPRLVGLDPESGALRRTLETPADAGSAFDGTHLYQLVESRIDKIDPVDGRVVSSIPAPGEGCGSGLAWAEGFLWVGQYQGRKIHQVDPATGEVLRTLESNRFVTGVTWVDGELWHGTWEDEQSELRQIDPQTAEVRQTLRMPAGKIVTGLEAQGDVFYCGGGSSGTLRVVERPR